MFKNFVILVSFYIIGSLLFQNPNNFDLIKNEARGVKNVVGSGTEYVKNAFHFATNPETFIEELKVLPEPVEGNQKIVEDTWFNEK